MKDRVRVIHGDCLEVLATFDAASIDAVVTDPPAGISFMGRDWDHHRGGRAQWVAWMETIAAECLRVAKPGAHALVWALPRTSHWTATAWENAGWTVRDRLAHGLNVVTQLIKLAIWQSPDHVPCAAQSSASIQVRSEEARAPIAVALAQILPVGAPALLTEIGGEVALHVPTDTWPSAWETRIGLSTTWSWNGSLDDACAETSRCITSIRKAADRIIDQKTYSWLTGLHTSGTTTRCSVTLKGGSPWPALTVNGRSTDVEANKQSILLVSALGDATWQPLGRFAGFNVSLKPACEDWWLLRKPLIGTVAQNVLVHGTGAINVDACRVATNDKLGGGGEKAETAGKFTNEGWRRPWMDDPEASQVFAAKVRANVEKAEALGRFPANLLHDGSDEVEAAFAAFGESSSSAHTRLNTKMLGRMNDDGWQPTPTDTGGFSDAGSPSRFFASCPFSAEELRFHYSGKADADDRAGSKHPTIKPVSLMRWLVRLITPPGGTVLDCFAGTGVTGEAAMLEGCNAVLIEREAEYVADTNRRLGRASGADTPLFAE